MPKQHGSDSSDLSGAGAGSAGSGVPAKRGPGRPKGLGRVPGSGRAKGTPNKDRAATIEKIMRLLDPLEFLGKVARGDRMEAAAKPGDKKRTHWFPTGDQRISAAQTLARKVLPDMKAVEYSGAEGGNLVIKIVRFGDVDHAP